MFFFIDKIIFLCIISIMRDKKMLGIGKNKAIKKARMSPLPLMKLTTYIEKLCQTKVKNATKS